MLENFRKYLGKNKTFSGVIVCVLFFLFYWGPSLKYSSSYLPDFGDTFHNIWIMSNSLKNLLSCGLNCMYEGNTFFPIRNSGAFAETLLGESLIYYPIFKITGNPQLSFNVVTYASFLLTSILLFYLLYLISGKFFLSIILANSFTYLPFRIVHVPHIQQISFFLVFIPIVFLVKFLKSGKLRDFLFFGIFFEIKAVSFGYNTFILYLVVGVLLTTTFIFEYFCKKTSVVKKRSLLLLFFGILFITILNLFTFYKPYIILAKTGDLRTLVDLNFYGADLLYFISVPASNNLYGNLVKRIRDIDYNGQITTLFIGITPIIIFKLIYKKLRTKIIRKMDFFDISIFISSLILFCLSFILILGPNVKFNGQFLFTNEPFIMLYKIGIGKFTRYVPAFIQLLVLSLTIILVILGKHTRIRINPFWMIVIVFITMIEYKFHINFRKWDYSYNNIPAVYRELADQKTNVPIVELPIQNGYAPSFDYFDLQMTYLYFSIFHDRKMLNGQSGFAPAEFMKNSEFASQFPSKSAIDYLKDIGVYMVVLHPKYYKNDLGEKISKSASENNKIKEIYNDPVTGDKIYSLN